MIYVRNVINSILLNVITVLCLKSFLALDKLWGHLLDSFSPWIQPLNNNGQVLSPWIERDAAHAEHMVLMFVQSVNFLLSQFEGKMLKLLGFLPSCLT